jgi:hypothetical protein
MASVVIRAAISASGGCPVGRFAARISGLASGLALAVRPACELVGRTGFEPVTSSVSGNFVNRLCFRILFLSCDVSSAGVHGRLSRSAAIVTQLVTRSSVSMSPATYAGRLVTTIHSCTGPDVVVSGRHESTVRYGIRELIVGELVDVILIVVILIVVTWSFDSAHLGSVSVRLS